MCSKLCSSFYLKDCKRKSNVAILSWGPIELEKLWNPGNMHHWAEAWCLVVMIFMRDVRTNVALPVLPQCLNGYIEGACRCFWILSMWVNEWGNQWTMQQDRKWVAFKLEGIYFCSQYLSTMRHQGIGENATKLYICWEDFSLHQKVEFHEIKTYLFCSPYFSKSSNMIVLNPYWVLLRSIPL